MNKLLLSFMLFIMACDIQAQEEIKMNKESDGLYTIPCEVNGLRLRFILDTGAYTVCLSLTEAAFMYKNGYLEIEDFIGTAQSLIASGEIQEDFVVNLKEVKIGTKIIKNIKAVVSKGISAPLLLGQSVLSQLGEWSIRNNYLVLKDRGGNDFSKYTETDWKQRIEETINTPADWDADLKYLLPGVVANDYNTILRAGYVLQYTKESTLKDEETVINKLKELAAKSDKEAIFSLGYFYLHKAKTINDIKISEEYFKKLIDGKTVFMTQQFYTYQTPYINLFLIYDKHLGLPEKAIQILQQGSLLNDASCVEYLMNEYDARKNYKNLYFWADKLSKTCAGFSKSHALYKKANCLMEGIGINKNPTEGIRILQQIANSKFVPSEDVYIDLCEYFSVKGNYEQVEEYALKMKFEKFFRRFYLGCAYYFMKNYSSARLEFTSLWKEDFARFDEWKLGMASCFMGHCFQDGLGGDINYSNAEKCYRYAYETCHYFPALGYLGDMYSNDKIYKEPNFEVAFGCYLQGAKNNDAYCCYMVSQCYKLGIGTKEDLKESGYWLKKAKENGWEEQ